MPSNTTYTHFADETLPKLRWTVENDAQDCPVASTHVYCALWQVCIYTYMRAQTHMDTHIKAQIRTPRERHTQIQTHTHEVGNVPDKYSVLPSLY